MTSVDFSDITTISSPKKICVSESIRSKDAINCTPSGVARASPLRCNVGTSQRKCRSLLSLCLGLLGRHLEQISDEISMVAPVFPPKIKICLIAIARRRGLLHDKLLLALADESFELLDISGSDVTDIGLEGTVKMCPLLKAADISRCSRMTSRSILALVMHCPCLQTLRCGGTSMSNKAIKLSLSYICPGLNLEAVEESWENLETKEIRRGALSLHWLIWPSVDEESKEFLEVHWPKVVLNPKPAKLLMHQVPSEAFPDRVLDDSIISDIDPRTWETGVSAQIIHDRLELPLAERFRLAFVKRDERLAPKRAKNMRQNQRRAEKVHLSSNVDAKARFLAGTIWKVSS